MVKSKIKSLKFQIKKCVFFKSDKKQKEVEYKMVQRGMIFSREKKEATMI